MHTIRIQIKIDLDASRALLESSRYARELGFDATGTRKISTVVSELARNILKYANEGEIVLSELDEAGSKGVLIRAIDAGPGIADTEEALRDHFSTGGTLGLGLPGVRRLVDEFQLESEPGQGTRVSAIFYQRPSTSAGSASTRTRAEQRSHLKSLVETPTSGVARNTKTTEIQVEFGKKLRPFPGERVCGDALYLKREGHKVFMGIVDGLGHGQSAHSVADSAVKYLSTISKLDPGKQLDALNTHLNGTPGAAIGVCQFDIVARRGVYAAVGNIVGRVIGSRGVQLRSQPGIIGSNKRTPASQEFSMDLEDVLLLYSDGVKESFTLSDYPQLLSQGAQTIASTLVRKFGKEFDDASCLVMRYTK